MNTVLITRGTWSRSENCGGSVAAEHFRILSRRRYTGAPERRRKLFNGLPRSHVSRKADRMYAKHRFGRMFLNATLALDTKWFNGVHP